VSSPRVEFPTFIKRSTSTIHPIPRLISCGTPLAALAGFVMGTRDKYTTKVPGGLAFSEFQRIRSSCGSTVKLGFDTFKAGTTASKPPQRNDAKCGFACHTPAKTRDYVTNR
jgi:hypothetical protein